jgi:hypothetical protein
MTEVTKDQFKEIYFKRGGGTVAGWGPEHWEKFYEPERPGWKYLIKEPETPRHSRMMIVDDFGKKEYRLFFMTEDDEDRFFDFPGKE